jgi:hypothetical protein
VEISGLDFANRRSSWLEDTPPNLGSLAAAFSGIYSLAFKFDPVILFLARSIEANGVRP